MKFSNLITNCFDFAFLRFSMLFPFAAICNKLSKLELLYAHIIRGQNWTVKTSKMKFSNFIANCVDFAFWGLSMIFTFAAVCNKLSKLKLPQDFRSLCTRIFITTNQGIEMDSVHIKDEVFDLYYELR